MKKVDSFPGFPRVNAVQPGTEACLTSRFGLLLCGSHQHNMRLGEPSPYGRPRMSNTKGFKKVMDLFVLMKRTSNCR